MNKSKFKKICAILLAFFVALPNIIAPCEVSAVETSVNNNVDYTSLSGRDQTALFDTPTLLTSGETRSLILRPYIIYKDDDEDKKNPIYPTGSVSHLYSIQTSDNNSFYKIELGNVSCKQFSYGIFDSTGTLLAADTNSSGNVAISKTNTMILKLDKNSTYYIIAYGPNGKDLDTLSNARILYTEIPDDCEDSFSEAKNITLDTSIKLTFDGYNDYDYVKFTTKNTPAFYNFYLNNENVGKKMKAEVYDSQIRKVDEFTMENNLGGYRMLYLEEDSTYYIVFTSLEKSALTATALGDYNFKLETINDDYYGDSIRANQIKYHQTYSGAIQADKDLDIVKFISGQNTMFLLHVENYSAEDSLSVQITDFYGNNVFASKNATPGFNGDILLSGKFQQNATYYIRISGKSNTDYTFSLSEVRYKISYVLNGGTNNSGNPKDFIANTTIVFKNPTKEGNVFKGWYTSSDFKGKPITDTTSLKGNTTIYAKWEKNKYEVSYVLNKGTNAKDQPTEFVYGDKKAIKNPTRKGYTFSGWYTNSKFTGSKITNTSTLSNNTKLYAKWTKVTSAKTSISKLTAAKKKLTVKFKSIKNIKGYQIRYSTNSKMKSAKTVNVSSKKTSYAISKLKAKTKYYVQIRTYKVDSTGAKVYSGWSSTKSLKTK